MKNSAPDFHSLANSIVAAGGAADPSETHGFICGVLAAGARPDKKRWQQELATQLDLEAVPAELNRALIELAQESQARLQDSDFDFQLLLSDDPDLTARTLTLGHWCQGFLHGFGIGNFKGKLQPTSEEALRDLGAIAQVDETELDDSEEGENQLLQVEEYVRVAVLNIFTEVAAVQESSRPATTGDEGGPTVH
ncbi:UPF0149 family protein [Microbulbifer yueqingensis]|uniref:YecA family protein n=1 Tax=Microbulbifer yueqingensis TaxID=658219 RepID=A0A1G8YEZ0_9GAMM|nr:UPF0149 family protein [Microbulbifer yueqingensis]SDK01432.1 hypothetical protein SAMN05216212_1472 [Microbulbifer yueqingensis]